MDLDVKSFIDDIVKDFGKQTLSLMNTVVEAIPTGSLALDISTGVGGIPKGRFTEIYGSDGTGKTTLAISISGNVIGLGGRVLFIDTENTLDFRLVSAMIPESNENNFIVLNPITLDDAFKAMLSGIESGLFDLVIMDSLPALPSEEELEKGMDRQTMMILPRKAGQFLRLSAVKVRVGKVAVILVNQVRANTKSAYGGFMTPGGHAVKHFNSIELSLTRGKAIEDSNGNQIGAYTNFNIRKNKVGNPFRAAQFPLIYGKGVDVERDIIEFADLIGIMNKRGSYVYYGDTNLGQGLMNASRTLEENKELKNEIINKCYEAVLGISNAVEPSEQEDKEEQPLTN